MFPTPRKPTYLLLTLTATLLICPIAFSATFTVTNSNDSGAGSLRQAILDSNNSAGTDTIGFNIPGSGIKTIAPVSGLPTISDPVVIDGTTQPGFTGMPLIELSGANVTGVNGLVITAGNSTVRALIIGGFISTSSFNGNGIRLSTNGGNRIEGNFIGTNATGTAAQPNRFSGILIDNSANNIIGGLTAGTRNILSGNERWGIQINSSSGNVVQGNYIGTEEAVLISTVSTGNQISSNLIFSSTMLGIDLNAVDQGCQCVGDGVTANDNGDVDSGGNNLQNFPMLSSATSSGAMINIQGSLNSSASQAFQIEFFANNACDASGNGEGQRFIGVANVTTNGSGDAVINASFSVAVSAGEFLTTTAIDSNGNTSEFSPCRQVVSGPVQSPDLIVDTSGPAFNQAAALDSMLSIRDPFQIANPNNVLNPGPDRNTRLAVFATNLSLAAGESSSSVIVNLLDGLGNAFDIPAEDVRSLPNTPFTQVVFRLPNNLAAGSVAIKLRWQNLTSNTVTLRIAQ